jgi:Cu/Zn superoxide dismutase
MKTTVRRWTLVFAAALAVSQAGTAMAASPTVAAGPLSDLQATVDPTDGATARVQVTQHAGGSTASLLVWGLDRAAAGTTYGAHVHSGDCVAGNGAAAGPHFNIDVYNGEPFPLVTTATEVWLDFTVRGDGTGSAVAQVPFAIPAGAASAVVIHALPTDATGAAGARLACLSVDL